MTFQTDTSMFDNYLNLEDMGNKAGFEFSFDDDSSDLVTSMFTKLQPHFHIENTMPENVPVTFSKDSFKVTDIPLYNPIDTNSSNLMLTGDSPQQLIQHRDSLIQEEIFQALSDSSSSALSTSSASDFTPLSLEENIPEYDYSTVDAKLIHSPIMSFTSVFRHAPLVNEFYVQPSTTSSTAAPTATTTTINTPVDLSTQYTPQTSPSLSSSTSPQSSHQKNPGLPSLGKRNNLDSRLSLEKLGEVLQTKSHYETIEIEKFILNIFGNELGFPLGYKTWIRDTNENYRRHLLDELYTRVKPTYPYMTKGLLETVIKRATYSMMQGRLRKERRASMKARQKRKSDK